ncbi:MAG: dynamin family protein [Bacteroidia bacterium]
MQRASEFLSLDLEPLRLQTGSLARQLQDLVADARQDTLHAQVADLREALGEPFLFVIVGEVKTGKSSFINALLATGEEITQVAPDPCTDTVQQIVFGERVGTVPISPYLKKILQPIDILRYISVVDTPGTNTILEQHQEITKRFIPRSDLVVFVFEAKNPYRQSAWTFFDYIHQDWQKKVIFVLQQSDLMEPADLAVNVAGLIRQAEKKGLADPRVFAVSAKLEQAGRTAESGFGPLRDYIRTHITGKSAMWLKLDSSLRSLRHLHGRFAPVLAAIAAQMEADRSFRADVAQTLDEQEARSRRQADQLGRNMLGDYDRITRQAIFDLDGGLSFFTLARRSLMSVFSKAETPQAWLRELTHRLEIELSNAFNRRLGEGVEGIADSIGQMARIIDLKIKNSSISLKPESDVFGDISDRRRIVLRDLQDGFERFVQDTDAFMGQKVLPEAARFSPGMATGTGIALIGIVLTAATQFIYLDITGGILSAVGLIFAGGTVALKRGKIIKGFTREIELGRERLARELDETLGNYIGHIRSRIDTNFEAFDLLLQTEQQHLLDFRQRHRGLDTALDTLAREIEVAREPR